MSHMICLYKLNDGHIIEIEMAKTRRALASLTDEDWSDYEGGDVFVEFDGLEPLTITEPKSNKLKNLFSRKKKIEKTKTEANAQEIDTDEHSIAFNRPQTGFEHAMFELMSKLNLIAIRDESFSETEAIISLYELKRSDIPDEIDGAPTENMELILVKDNQSLLQSLYS